MAAHTNGAVPDDVRAAAGCYLGRGRLPIPVPRQGNWKAPLLDAWEDLRPQPEDLDTLFPRGQALNVGLLLGVPSGGLIDLDLDVPEAIAAAPLLLPPTGWVSGRSSKPRSHWWYLVADPPDHAAEEFHDLDGAMLLEFRSTRGQTVVPPSIHQCGEQLIWHNFVEPRLVGLRDLRAAAAALASVALLARHWPGQGSRQQGFLALAGGLLRAGWDQERVEQVIDALAVVTDDEEARKRVRTVLQTAEKLQNDKKVSGWPTLEKLLGPPGKDVVARVRGWLGLLPGPAPGGRTRVRVLEPYVPFPLDTLPQPLRNYVEQGGKALGCDAAFLALPVLAVVASLVGNTRVLRLKRTWDEVCVVWAALVGDSGTLKSPAYLKAVAYLFRLQKRLLEEFKIAQADYQEQRAEYQSTKRQAKDDGTDPGEPPEAPVLQRVVTGDVTIEKLAEILEDNPRGTLLARDELAGWLGSFTRYKGKQGGTDLPNWLEMHRAGAVVVDRKTGERRTLFVDRAAVSVTGGIQPGVLARVLTPEFLDAGLAARLLMGMPPKQPKRWTEAEIDPDAEEAYHKLLDKLLALEFDTNDGEKAPHVLRLSAEAKAAWVRFYDGWGKEQAAAEGELAAAFSKLEAYAARFTLLHHVITCVWLDVSDLREVGVKNVEAGVALSRWFAHEARRIYATLSESVEERDARQLVEFIRARGGLITARQLQKSNSRKYPSAVHAEVALEALVPDHGNWVERPTTAKGGQPTRAFRLHPTSDTTDTTPREDDEDDGLSPAAPDTTPDPSPATPGISAENGGCVGSVGRRTESPAGPEEPAQRHVEHQDGTGTLGVVSGASGSAPPFTLVRDIAGLEAVRVAVNNSRLVAVDVETTGLDPRTDRVRLLSLVTQTDDAGMTCSLVDCSAVDPTPLWPTLATRELVLHNALFDIGFLARRGFTPTGVVHDTMLLAQLLVAGTSERVSLDACCRRWLDRSLDKAQQKSDWSGPLGDAQLAYAARDVEVLLPLLGVLQDKINEANLDRAAELERRCLPAVVWMARNGVAFDPDAWRALATQAQRQAEQVRQELDQAAPPQPGEMFDAWNWESPQQARQALALAGCVVQDTTDETLAALDHPLARLLRRYRLARKRGSTYGTNWLQHVATDGRVYTHWRQCGARTGRMSSADPCLQNIPRDRAYRRCFRAPEGRVLVKADLSQIELRIAAKVAGDTNMIEAFRRGEDLHALTARRMTGKDEVTPQERQMAKPVNFGMIYGLGAASLRAKARTDYGLELSEEEAERYRRAFFVAYPAVKRWHGQIRRAKATQTRTLVGRRVLVKDHDFFGAKANYVVQGTGGDGIKQALALLWERRREIPGALPVLAVHDEIVVECDAGQAEAVQCWLRQALVDGMAPLLEPVPVEVEVKVAHSWGGD